MRTTGFLLLVLMLFIYSDASIRRPPGRADIKKIGIDCSGYPSKKCTADYRPLCGAIRTTYGNKCAFCNAYVDSDGKLELDYLGECGSPRKE